MFFNDIVVIGEETALHTAETDISPRKLTWLCAWCFSSLCLTAVFRVVWNTHLVHSLKYTFMFISVAYSFLANSIVGNNTLTFVEFVCQCFLNEHTLQNCCVSRDMGKCGLTEKALNAVYSFWKLVSVLVADVMVCFWFFWSNAHE